MDMEIQNKAAVNLLAIGKDPSYAAGWKKWEALRRFVRASRFDPADFIHDDATIKVNEENLAKQQRGDPRVEVATIRAEADAKIEQARIEFEKQDNERERQNKLVVAAIDERMNSTALTSDERQNLEKIKATLAGKVIEVRAQERLSSRDQAQERDLALAGHKMSAFKHKNPVARPQVEPPGRAAPGKSFQQ